MVKQIRSEGSPVILIFGYPINFNYFFFWRSLRKDRINNYILAGKVLREKQVFFSASLFFSCDKKEKRSPKGSILLK